MTLPLPHRREQDRNEPDVCTDCRLPWTDLFTGDNDECPARLRATLDGFYAAVRWINHPNDRHYYTLTVASVVLGSVHSKFDRVIGHVVLATVKDWSEEAKWSRQDAMHAVERRLGLPMLPEPP